MVAHSNFTHIPFHVGLGDHIIILYLHLDLGFESNYKETDFTWPYSLIFELTF